MKRVVAGTVCGILLLGAVACSGTDEATAPTSVSNPLSEYLGSGGGFSSTGMSSSLAAGDDEQRQQVQDLVAVCMKDAGFEYLPFVPTAPAQQPVLEGDPDWAATYGYGISTVDAAMPDPADDPNTAITQAMSEAERAAYFEALFGSSPQMTGPLVELSAAPPAGALPEGRPDNSSTPPVEDTDAIPGCFPQASAQVYGEPEVVDLQEFDALFEALRDLQASVAQDPRLTPLVTAWADCMADAGHPGWSGIDDARNSIMSRWADLNGWEFTPMDGSGGSVSVDGSDVVEEPDPAQVAELRTDEIALAVIDLGCRGDYQAVRQEVQAELEQEFVDQHLAELKRYRDATGGGN